MSEPSDKLKSMLTQQRLGHDSNQLLIDIMERFGGTKQFANELYLVFKDQETTNYARQNILEMIQKLVVNNTNHNITKVVDPSGLDDDDIDAELQAILKKGADFLHERSAPIPETQGSPEQAEGPVEGDEWDWSA